MPTLHLVPVFSAVSFLLPLLGARLWRESKLSPALHTEQEVLVRSTSAGRLWACLATAMLLVAGLSGFVASLIWDLHPGELGLATLMLAMGLAATPILLRGMWNVYLANDLGVSVRTPGGKLHAIAWSELADLRLRLTHLRFSSNTGATIRLPLWLPGLRQFADHARKHVTPIQWRQWQPNLERLHRRLREMEARR